MDALAGVAREQEGDTIYAIDCISEELVAEFFQQEARANLGIILIAEGLPGGEIILPRGMKADDAKWRIIIDPIDGTRGLMYQKRSAWILTGVAPNRGPETNLQDIELAVQTEIPLIKQHLSDAVWTMRGQAEQDVPAIGGQGQVHDPGRQVVEAERSNRLTGEVAPLRLKPSGSHTIAHGFAMVSRFFPGAREELAALDEEIVRGALGPVQPGKTQCFEDQYASTGGQLFELMAGHDRFVADLRPLMEGELKKRGLALGICCHPYDICTELIARQLGVIVTDPAGNLLRAPLAVEPDIAWVGYANQHIRLQIEPLLQSALHRRGLA